MRISVIGTSYTALAIGVSLANEGHDVCFIDSDENISYVKLDDIDFYVPNDNITFSTDLETIETSDVVFNSLDVSLSDYECKNIINIYNGDTISDDVYILLYGITELLG